jgi:mRNA interferase HigB
VKVIGLDKISDAVAQHKEWEASLTSWKKMTEGASWRNFPEVRKTRKDADPVGTCIVFNIAHNRARLISRVMYDLQTVAVLRVIDHAEYDKGAWKNACNCN